MPDYELLSTCPFFNDGMHSEMPEMDKEQCCKGDYAWCGRYLVFKALKIRTKTDWVCDEEGLICSACGKDIYHCECEETEGIVEIELHNAKGREDE